MIPGPRQNGHSYGVRPGPRRRRGAHRIHTVQHQLTVGQSPVHWPETKPRLCRNLPPTPPGRRTVVGRDTRPPVSVVSYYQCEVVARGNSWGWILLSRIGWPAAVALPFGFRVGEDGRARDDGRKLGISTASPRWLRICAQLMNSVVVYSLREINHAIVCDTTVVSHPSEESNAPGIIHITSPSPQFAEGLLQRLLISVAAPRILAQES